MRDPGLPRRNPFFDHASDPDASSPAPGFRVVGEAEPPAGGGAPESEGDPGADAFATLLGLVQAVGEAQPEATEHLVAAAHELVLAVKVVVDATEAVLAEQRIAMAARRDDGS